jgi:hypothetical protein
MVIYLQYHPLKPQNISSFMCKNFGMLVFEDSGEGLTIIQNSAIRQVYIIRNIGVQSAFHKNETVLMLVVDLCDNKTQEFCT